MSTNYVRDKNKQFIFDELFCMQFVIHRGT